ncbi:MAG: tetratricopeptide repeat protein [Lentisphaeria bacterium]|nr:tetratricopeptide repeat protein [Lentisphaeria bacterium]
MHIRSSLQAFFNFQKRTFALFCVLLPGILIFSLYGEEPDLTAGDNAFAAKDYAVAASFYTRYLNKLKAIDADKNKLREAYERLMDSLLFGELTANAEKYLEEYKKLFPDAKELSVDMWQGELLLQKGYLTEALPVYEKILSSLHGRDPRRLRALSAYARTLESLSRYQEASKAYHMLREQAGNTPMGENAFLRETLTAIHAKDFLRAEQLTAEAETFRDNGRTHTLLQACLLLKKEGLAAGKPLWEKLLSESSRMPAGKETADPLPENRKDFLLYLVASLYGDAFFNEKDLPSAAAAYRLAYHAAGSNKELFQTLSRLIRTISSSGNGKEAADLAEKQVEYFRHPLVNNAAKLRIAEILKKNGRNDSAVKLYSSVFHDFNATQEQCGTSCRNYLLIMLREKKTRQALTVLREFFKQKNRQQEGELLIAETLAESGHFKESLSIYETLGDTVPSLAPEAFYKALRIAIHTRENSKVAELYEKLMLSRPTSGGILRELPFLEGMKNMLSGKKEEAEKLFAKYIHTKPAAQLQDLLEALKACSMLSLEKKDYKKAVYCLHRLVKEFPGHSTAPLAAYWLMHLYFLQNDELSAEQTAWFLAGKYPASDLVPEALLRLCRHYTENGAYNKASAVLDRLMKMPSSAKGGKMLEGKVLYERSRIAAAQGRTDEALELLQKTVKITSQGPVYQEAGCKMGELLYKMGRIDEALEAYTKASVAAGSDPLLTFAAQGALGNILLSARSQDQESLKQALACFQTIAGENTAPEEFRAEAAYKAGRCHELLGEKDEAENLYKQLLYSCPAKKAMKNPAVSIWCVKAAECLIDSAAKTPVLSAFENARNALRYLYDAGLISRKDAQNRFNTLKQMKFNP